MPWDGHECITDENEVRNIEVDRCSYIYLTPSLGIKTLSILHQTLIKGTLPMVFKHRFIITCIIITTEFLSLVSTSPNPLSLS